MKKQSKNALDSDALKIMEARHHDPFAILGRHLKNNHIQVKVYLPYAETVCFSHNGAELNRLPGYGLF